MIRRAATQFTALPQAGQPEPTGSKVFVLALMLRTDASSNQTLIAAVEDASSGYVSEVSALLIKFEDGSPAIIPEI